MLGVDDVTRGPARRRIRSPRPDGRMSLKKEPSPTKSESRFRFGYEVNRRLFDCLRSIRLLDYLITFDLLELLEISLQ